MDGVLPTILRAKFLNKGRFGSGDFGPTMSTILILTAMKESSDFLKSFLNFSRLQVASSSSDSVDIYWSFPFLSMSMKAFSRGSSRGRPKSEVAIYLRGWLGLRVFMTGCWVDQ